MIVFSPLASARLARRLLYLPVLFLLAAFAGSTADKRIASRASAATQSHWYRGNTHTHTNNSFDGDSSPVAVATAYRSLGYNFLVVTDHNKLTNVDGVNAQVGIPGHFLVIKGEEVTDSFNGNPAHIIAVNNFSPIAPQHGSDVLNTVQNDVDAIAQAGGISIVAHPNYQFGLTSSDLSNVTGTMLFEIYNAHPYVNNFGDDTHSSVESKWDDALSGGKLLYGLGVDDMHTLTNPSGPMPGRGWVMVRAASLDANSIIQALTNGDFYASNGVTLQDYQVSTSSMTITLDTGSSEAWTIDFIGRNGQLLQRNSTSPAVYSFTGHEQYVRAKITNNEGQAAWTQPIYTERLSPADAILNAGSAGKEPGAIRAIAPDSVALASGIGLAHGAVQAQRQADGTFPTSLAGTTVSINGRPAEIFFVSGTQVSFHVPAETELGVAQVLLTNADGIQMRSQITVADTAPGVFTKNGQGQGEAVVFDLDNLYGGALMPDSTLRRFYVYATGVRGDDDVQVMLNGLPVAVEAVKACRGLPGLDQITIVLPRNLTGTGDSTLVIQVNGVVSNTTILHL